MGNLYNKTRKQPGAPTDLPEARAMRYVPFEATHKIAQTSKCAVQLQKSRLMQKWRLLQHHSIPFRGLDNIHKILTAPNRTKVTIYQVIMSIKLVKGLITPLFIGVDFLLKATLSSSAISVWKKKQKAFSPILEFMLRLYLALLCEELLPCHTKQI